MTGITPAPLRALRRRVAVLVGEVLSPGVLVTVALPLVGWTGTRSLTGVGWGLFAALCCVAVPYIVLFLGVRRGYWQDHHLRDRRQRTVPFLIATGCALTGCAVLLLLDAPRIVLALVVAILAGLVSTSVVNRWWKISVHTTSAAGVATALAFTYGLMWGVAAPAVALVAWSRVELDHHTVAQVVAGALQGAVVCGTVFALLH
ncbi:phosphatase PAP2 family protein [Thermobifida fusca]|uniref:Phosphatidic acid phosphatase type 2/haloperoxidase domain-containing protein n=2 Tax=Thermobifida fusca TaxID=2021 RepID=A0A9P2TA62_THEFU|nr:MULTISPECIES: hypothetical protein [Thermobifida]AAZ55545.1 hypothetical protein Tfu_1509 [Thermobifida fusca YX]EOR71392.1 hypothetical protein TM51_07896 [Thermobifida fusca TM51]MBO2531021.1 hypothetical protein [Thermobifida sp.]MDD6792626.1 hypothetical protein [Thermobifida fusca]PPS91849.1 hypothetical protein BH05_12910 [Thermobifida fusca]